jgi:hypothetical protein
VAADDVVLKQSGLATAVHLVLTHTLVVSKGDLLSGKKELRLRDVTAVLRDKEQLHIVGSGDAPPLMCLHKPGNAAYEYFVDQLISRLVKQA